jgi:TPR repeat protein
MKHRKIGENISREWDRDLFNQELWRALQLIEHDPLAGVQELESLSQRGSGLSMMYLGHALFVGRYGLESDQVLGESWLSRSADLGSMEAYYTLAKDLQDVGRGEEALEWFKKAANFGYSPAMFAVGWKYYFGQNVERDIVRAHEYFKRAADTGHLYGVLWESHSRREIRSNTATWMRNLSIRIPLVFRLIFALITYPSSDRLRK